MMGGHVTGKGCRIGSQDLASRLRELAREVDAGLVDDVVCGYTKGDAYLGFAFAEQPSRIIPLGHLIQGNCEEFGRDELPSRHRKALAIF